MNLNVVIYHKYEHFLTSIECQESKGTKENWYFVFFSECMKLVTETLMKEKPVYIEKNVCETGNLFKKIFWQFLHFQDSNQRSKIQFFLLNSLPQLEFSGLNVCRQKSSSSFCRIMSLNTEICLHWAPFWLFGPVRIPKQEKRWKFFFWKVFIE